MPRFFACVPQLTPASTSDPGDSAFFVASVESVWSETHFAHLIRLPDLHFFVPSVGVEQIRKRSFALAIDVSTLFWPSPEWTIAAMKAAEAAEKYGWDQSRTVGSAVASDAFFPFADGLLAAAEAGASAIIQPGGSIRDEEVIAAADEQGLAMVFTGMRHFRH